MRGIIHAVHSMQETFLCMTLSENRFPLFGIMSRKI